MRATSHSKRSPWWSRIAALAATLPLLLLGACTPETTTTAQPPVKHIFVIMLENVSYDSAYGPAPVYPYLANTLRPNGLLLSQFYAVAHWSLGNYLAIIGGVAPTKDIQGDCTRYTDMTGGTPAPDGQVKAAHGCVYPKFVPTLAGQLTDQHLSWKGYMQDMGNIPGREQASCGRPGLGANGADLTQEAAQGDNYAARHNPFIYFSSVRDTPACGTQVVPLTQLATDLHSDATTPNFSFISPNLCDDGHNQCTSPQDPDSWLKTWIPLIQASPAYKSSAIIILADEAKNDSRACCMEASGPNLAYPGGPTAALLGAEGGGKGGGLIGALVLSPFVKPGSTSTVPYNDYSLLGSIEDLFGLSHLGYAASPNVQAFGPDVWNPATSKPSP